MIPLYPVNKTSDRKPENEPSLKSPVAAPPKFASANGETRAYLDQGSRISGKLVFEGSVRIDGHVDGEIIAKDVLTIGEGAVIKAQITGDTVIIAGKVDGDIVASRRIELRPTAKVHGNLKSPAMQIEQGALFEGHCTMNLNEKHQDKHHHETIKHPEAKPRVEHHHHPVPEVKKPEPTLVERVEPTKVLPVLPPKPVLDPHRLYLNIHGAPKGPFTDAEILDGLKSRNFPTDALVSNSQTGPWIPISEKTEFKSTVEELEAWFAA